MGRWDYKTLEEGQTKCCTCGYVGLREEFASSTRKGITSLNGKCKPCHAAWRVEYNQRESTKRYRRNYRLMTEYGISLVDYEAMLKSQGGGCAICGGTDTGKTGFLSVDHDHKTGNVRALLCQPCNLALGFMQDNPERLRLAADYVEGHAA